MEGIAEPTSCMEGKLGCVRNLMTETESCGDGIFTRGMGNKRRKLKKKNAGVRRGKQERFLE